MESIDSLPDSLNEFLKAIDEMSNTVLVPQRLVDIPEQKEIPIGNCPCTTSEDIVLVKPSKEMNDSSLYGTYHMLLDVKEELITGRRTSAQGCLRSHVKAVTEGMKHLTILAKSLTQQYCDEVCNDGSQLRPNSFSYSAFEDMGKRNGINVNFQLRDGEARRRKHSI